jgi:hypothetical protein
MVYSKIMLQSYIGIEMNNNPKNMIRKVAATYRVL